jgi:BlaI family transcriptional regulator, penicillinase repressor
MQNAPRGLSRRERQIMDVIYRHGRATVQQVLDQLEAPPSYSSIRAIMRLLEEKGHLRHVSEGPRYVYLPTRPKETARKSALNHVLTTFFDDSVETAVATLLDVKARQLSDDELDRLQRLIADARNQER